MTMCGECGGVIAGVPSGAFVPKYCMCPNGVRRPRVGLDTEAMDLLRRTLHAEAEADEQTIPTTLAEQVGALMPYMDLAMRKVLRMQASFGTRPPLPIEPSDAMSLAGQRIVTGHAEHGANLFHMSDAELAENLAEELADAIVYRAEQLRREALA